MLRGGAPARGRGAQGSSTMYTLSSLTQHWESLKCAPTAPARAA